MKDNNVTYFIDQEKKVVVCLITDCYKDAYNRLNKYRKSRIKTENIDNVFGIVQGAWQLYIPNEFKGVAKCSPEDEFDVEVGMKIALTKAKAKRCKAINRVIDKYIKFLQNDIKILSQYAIHEVPKVEGY